jgi:flagellar basal-body rod modification protein FlgD
MTTVDPASAIAAGSATRGRLAGDMRTFLTLLTTQLRNQDPAQPMDANQLTAQLVQFATVEQQLSMNRTLEALLGLQQASGLTEAAALVGRRVEAEGDRLVLQDGQAELRLPAGSAAQTARIAIRDASGALLREEEVRLDAGPRDWTWDGHDAAGTRLPDGGYQVSVTGRGPDGAASVLPFTIAGRVTGALREGGEVMLRLGTVNLPFGRLRSLGG